MPPTISNYEIREKIGQGGMGVVYRAVDLRLNRPVAIKVIAPSALGDAKRVRRFVQEARAASAFSHPQRRPYLRNRRTVQTPFVEGYLEKYHKHEKEQVRADLNKRQPMGRLGKPEEIAHMALYLCSQEAEFVNGSVQTIDGG